MLELFVALLASAGVAAPPPPAPPILEYDRPTETRAHTEVSCGTSMGRLDWSEAYLEPPRVEGLTFGSRTAASDELRLLDDQLKMYDRLVSAQIFCLGERATHSTGLLIIFSGDKAGMPQKNVAIEFDAKGLRPSSSHVEEFFPYKRTR